MPVLMNTLITSLASPSSERRQVTGRSLGSKEKLEWEIRYKIALGTAEGLSYLHEGCERRIIHTDIKAANILLREDFEPQVYLSSDQSMVD
ncbi:hypothetical protein RHMOL_Rhmol01G0224500 [Rhododendron molle]|uniref:Uncharacterized protein n=1 Tax=Rhododendron molle TaxID=49168 RepID=A0ACC0Q3W5_RHOML|nr:hypothetical protein RHMOL_Rhmol01G0224500 [Rhododendron molle]